MKKNNRYLAWVRLLPCLICRKPAEPHHVPPRGQSAMGMKTSDERAIPLCHQHHQEYHSQGRLTFAEKYNADYEIIIDRLRGIYDEFH